MFYHILEGTSRFELPFFDEPTKVLWVSSGLEDFVVSTPLK